MVNINDKKENEISKAIIGSAIEIHKSVGPVLLESAYESALAYDLKDKGYDVKTQVRMPFKYKEVILDPGYIIDLIVDDLVLVELKSIENVLPVHYAQTLTFLKLSG